MNIKPTFLTYLICHLVESNIVLQDFWMLADTLSVVGQNQDTISVEHEAVSGKAIVE